MRKHSINARWLLMTTIGLLLIVNVAGCQTESGLSEVRSDRLIADNNDPNWIVIGRDRLIELLDAEDWATQNGYKAK